MVVLYLVWRLAHVVGRRRLEEYQNLQGKFTGQVAKCQLCGALRPLSELEDRGWGPWRKLHCRGGCLESHP